MEADESDRSLLDARARRSPCSPTPSSTTTRPTPRSATSTRRSARSSRSPTARRSSGTARRCSRSRPPALPLVPFDAAPELTAGGSRFALDGVAVELTVPGTHNARNAAAALTAARLAGADLGRGGRRAARLPGRRPALRAAGRDAGGRAGGRRLRAPPDGGRRDARGGAHARAPARDRGLPAAPVLAHRATRPRSSAPRWPPPTRSSCSTSTRRASAPRTSRASPGCSSPRRRPTPPAGGRSAWLPRPARRPRRYLRGAAARRATSCSRSAPATSTRWAARWSRVTVTAER